MPHPSIAISRAPGIHLAVSHPASSGTSGSSTPWITRVGAEIRFSRARRSGVAMIASNWRSVPAGS
ncbi:MAG: hypothetical protein KJZ97_11635 [Burkholderiaceae bacterium]|nr:hypothetical protein [Burkholderiaceae bacterium]